MGWDLTCLSCQGKNLSYVCTQGCIQTAQDLCSWSNDFQACLLYSASSWAAQSKDSKWMNCWMLLIWTTRRSEAHQLCKGHIGTPSTEDEDGKVGQQIWKDEERRRGDFPGKKCIKPEMMHAEWFINAEPALSVFWQGFNNPIQKGLTSLLLLRFLAERPLCAVQKVTQKIHCFRWILFDHM